MPRMYLADIFKQEAVTVHRLQATRLKGRLLFCLVARSSFGFLLEMQTTTSEGTPSP